MIGAKVNPRRVPSEIWWPSTEPHEHSLQIYHNASLMLDSVEGFVAGGLRAGEATIVIAKGSHRAALERRLAERGFDLARARTDGRYVAADAETTLQQLLVDDWPDAQRFRVMVKDLNARTGGRRVRAFGEMVVLLWKRGLYAATIELEQLWNEVCAAQGLRLFCAYPHAVFEPQVEKSLQAISAQHSRMIPE